MDELANMKTLWQELSLRVSSLEEENRLLARKVLNQNFKTAREKLVRKYTFFSCLSLFMIIYMIFFVGLNPLGEEKYRLLTLIYMGCFFIFEGSVDLYLRYKLKNLDIYAANIKEIVSQAKQNWKLHKISVCIGLPLAIGAIIILGLFMGADIYAIYGLIIGGIIGLIIGFRQLLSFRETYRLLETEEEMNLS